MTLNLNYIEQLKQLLGKEDKDVNNIKEKKKMQQGELADIVKQIESE